MNIDDNCELDDEIIFENKLKDGSHYQIYPKHKQGKYKYENIYC